MNEMILGGMREFYNESMLELISIDTTSLNDNFLPYNHITVHIYVNRKQEALIYKAKERMRR